MKRLPEVKLSIIILTYNVEKVIVTCLDSVYQNLEKDWEVILIDNNSDDKTLELVKSKNYSQIKIIKNESNKGFSAGNNLAVKKALGEYVLFLNPDTVVNSQSISEPLKYLENHPEVGVLTVKVLLGNGELDDSCHRGFPTPWNALCYFSGMNWLFPQVKLFSGYTLSYLDTNTSHEVDAINGAFWMMKRSLGERLSWFDESFFWKGEDLDFCYRIKQAGYKIFYLATAHITHYKGSSGGHKAGSRSFEARFEVMRQFYDKHYRDKYPAVVTWLVYLGIKARKLLAVFGR